MSRKYDWDDDYLRYDDEDEELLPKARGAGTRKQKKKKKKQPMKRTFFLLFGCLVVLVGYMTVGGMFDPLIAKIAGRFVKNNTGSFQKEELSYSFEKPDNIPEGYFYDENVINILLVGIEGIGSSDAYSGRSDSMMIATLHMDTGELSLTSLLRDTYVEIPGHGGCKLNAAYAYGGLDLLITTIQDTWKIYLDGVVRVNFDEFEAVIDTLGGVDIELTAEEADYLNKTNYISNKDNRMVRAGWNHLNGNQALGYCRVRKVATTDGTQVVYSDFGRTTRQRKVLSALFESYKNYDKMKLLSVTKEILGHVTSSLGEKQISACINAYMEHKPEGILQYQIPAKGYFTGETKDCGDCLVPNYEANVAILQHFLYGKKLPDGIRINK